MIYYIIFFFLFRLMSECHAQFSLHFWVGSCGVEGWSCGQDAKRNPHEAFEPPVYEKSADQEARINDVLSKSFLFNALSKDDLKVSAKALVDNDIEHTRTRYKRQRVTRQLSGSPSLCSHRSLVISHLRDYCLQDSAVWVYGDRSLHSKFSRSNGAYWEPNLSCGLTGIPNSTSETSWNQHVWPPQVILGAFLEKKIPAGERIIQEGDDGDVMFLIESGAFDCIKKIDGHLQCKTCLSAHQSTIYHLPCTQEPLPVIMILRLFNIIHIYIFTMGNGSPML